MLSAALFCAACSPAPYVRVADPKDIELYAESGRFAKGQPSAFHVTDDGKAVLFLRGKKTQDLWELDVATKKERVLLTADSILAGAAAKLSDKEKALMERLRSTATGIRGFELSENQQSILVPIGGKLFLVNRGSGDARALSGPAEGVPFDARFSPDGARLAYVKSGALYVYELATGTETRITPKETADISWGTAEFVAQEEMDRYHGYWFGPDGKTLVVQRTDETKVEKLWIHDPKTPESAPHQTPYPRAGTENAVVELALFSVGGGDQTWVKWDREAFPYVRTVRWQKGAPLTVVVQNRAQTEERVLVVDNDTGQSRQAHAEKDTTWLNIDQGFPHWLDGDRFLWATERGGQWEVELRSRAGSRLRSVVSAKVGYKALLRATSEGLWLQAFNGPLDSRVVFVPLDPAGKTRVMADAPGAHYATVGQDGTWVHTHIAEDGARHSVVRKQSGADVARLTSNHTPMPWVPNVEFTTVKIGQEGAQRELNCALVRPRNVEEGRKYPVVVYVYGGPHYQVVTRNQGRYFTQQFLADHGFIVAMIDGRGTPGRGRAWERSIHLNVIDGPLSDQVAGLAALGQRFEELDTTRVGIYGWSFGGYFTAHAIMRHPEVYKAAFSGAPVADWRDYDTHYTERYMGLPKANKAGYDKASAITYSKQLKRPLIIAHGTVDDNVYLVNTLRLSDALFRADKPHAVLPLSGFTHMVHGKGPTRSLYVLIAEHFVTHLKP